MLQGRRKKSFHLHVALLPNIYSSIKLTYHHKQTNKKKKNHRSSQVCVLVNNKITMLNNGLPMLRLLFSCVKMWMSMAFPKIIKEPASPRLAPAFPKKYPGDAWVWGCSIPPRKEKEETKAIPPPLKNCRPEVIYDISAHMPLATTSSHGCPSRQRRLRNVFFEDDQVYNLPIRSSVKENGENAFWASAETTLP